MENTPGAARRGGATRTAATTPAKEVSRCQAVERLRAHHRRLISSLVGIDPPKNSYERWALERALVARAEAEAEAEAAATASTSTGSSGSQRAAAVSALLEAGACRDAASTSLRREVLEDVPVKVNMWPRDRSQAMQSLALWAREARALLADGPRGASLTADEVGIVRGAICDAERRAAAPGVGAQDVVDIIKILKQQCRAIFDKKMMPLATQVCEELKKIAFTEATELEVFIAKPSSPLLDPNSTANRKEIYEAVRIATRGTTVELAYSSCNVTISKQHFNKLCELWSRAHPELHTEFTHAIHASDFPDGFLSDAFCLMLRMQAMIGSDKAASLHAAVPQAHLTALHQRFGVTCECFASPLNCFLPQYCSAYHDTDAPFGSLGSFFEYTPNPEEGGSFEANPPFVEELIIAMALRMEKLLSICPGPLSYAIVLPNWEDAEGLQMLLSSKFQRASAVLASGRHSFVSGSQHTTTATTFKAVHDSRVIFLQNDCGASKWPVNEESILVAFT